MKLAALQPWIDWAKEKGLLTQLGCRGSESHMCQTSACLAFGFVFVVDSCCLLFAGRIAVSNTPGKWRQNRSLFDCFQGTNTIGWLKKCSKLSHFGPTDIQNSWENSDKRRCNASITNTSHQIRSHRSRWAIFLNMCEWRRFYSELTLTLYKLKFPKHSYLQDPLGTGAAFVTFIHYVQALWRSMRSQWNFKVGPDVALLLAFHFACMSTTKVLQVSSQLSISSLPAIKKNMIRARKGDREWPQDAPSGWWQTLNRSHCAFATSYLGLCRES